MAQIPPNILYVSTSFTQSLPDHEFAEIQKAINFCEDFSKTKIILYSDFLGQHELEMPNRNTNITIDGLNQYGITFDRDIANIGESQFLKFRNLTYIRGRRVLMEQDNSNFGIYDIQSAMIYISMDRGRYSNAYIHRSKFYGADDSPAIVINNLDAGVEVFDSYVKGGSRYPAIYFGVESDEKVKIKESSLHHYQPGDVPIQVANGITAGLCIYNSVSDGRMCQNDEDGHVNNYIVNNNNILREEHIDY